MSQFVVNLSEPEKDEPQPETPKETKTPVKSEKSPDGKKRGGCGKILGIGGALLGVILLVGAVVGYFYWQGVKNSPQYSLALLVDAARRNDQKAIDELVDTDAVVDSFMPQIADKATELYGKNIPADKIAKIKDVSSPLLPAIKQRARQEVPRVIQDKTGSFASVPYWAIALGAGYYLDVKQNGEQATVTSKIPERPFELTMKRFNDKWRVVGIKDEALAKRIAENIGQELIAISSKEALKKAGEKMNVPNLEDLKKKVDDIFGSK
ncbi:MAG: DUF2939 domain-containing protein [Acidobacteria bacterium]|nr:DUF2939 domain-containing protein [Acidobacteriota bacterium]